MNYYESLSARLGNMTKEQLKKELDSYRFLYEENLNGIHKIETDKLDFLVNATLKTKTITDDDDDSYDWEYYYYVDENQQTWEYETIDDMIDNVFEPIIRDFRGNIKNYKEHIERIVLELQNR
ncbi:MAG: hypothetical protein ACRCX2_04295 [Paraclostridium sp.]